MRRRRPSPIAFLAAAFGVSAALVFFACCGCCIFPSSGGSTSQVVRSPRSSRPTRLETAVAPRPGPPTEPQRESEFPAKAEVPIELSPVASDDAEESEQSPAEPPPVASPPAPQDRPPVSADIMSLDAVRLWTSADGTNTVEAIFQSYGQGVVILERPDGDAIEVSIEELSERDQALIRKGR